jgi:hypothetical protein
VPKAGEVDRIAQLQAEGRLDSLGQFSVDFARGRETLRRFSQQFSDQYLLQLVRSAVLDGATRCEMGQRGHGSASTLMAPASPRDLECLIDDLLLDEYPPERGWLRCLALGVLGALEFRPPRADALRC